MLLAELRAQLIRAKAESLVTQGILIANILAETATTGEPEPRLQGRAARDVLRRVRVPETSRVRIFWTSGEPVADSDVLSDKVGAFPLPPLKSEDEPADKGLLPAGFAGTTVLPWRPDFTLSEAIAAAAAGKIQSGQRMGEGGERVVSVSLPIQHVEAVVGVLTIESGDVDEILAAERLAIFPFILAAGAVLLMSSLMLALLIARPLRVLATAADRLRLGASPHLEAPQTLLQRKDEIGDLAQALQRMTSALLERIDSNARFAADVSHEIKNPLTSIRSAVETAQNVENPEARERLLKIIAADVGRVDRLITDISLASRIEAETARGAATRIDMKRMLGDLVETYEATRREGQPNLRLHIEQGVNRFVVGQEDAMGQVFRNLLDNAKSFGPPGTEVLVSIVASPKRDTVRITVEDAGHGIPPENLETIFRRFYTDRPKGAAFGGNSGLGLSIARQIVETHKGTLWAENILNEHGGIAGARFIVELPTGLAAAN